MIPIDPNTIPGHVVAMAALDPVDDAVTAAMDRIDAVAPQYSHLRGRLLVSWGMDAEEPMEAVAALFAAFDAFTRTTWGMSGPAAFETDDWLSDQWNELDQFIEPAGTQPGAVELVEQRFRQLWEEEPQH